MSEAVTGVRTRKPVDLEALTERLQNAIFTGERSTALALAQEIRGELGSATTEAWSPANEKNLSWLSDLGLENHREFLREAYQTGEAEEVAFQLAQAVSAAVEQLRTDEVETREAVHHALTEFSAYLNWAGVAGTFKPREGTMPQMTPRSPPNINEDYLPRRVMIANRNECAQELVAAFKPHTEVFVMCSPEDDRCDTGHWYGANGRVVDGAGPRDAYQDIELVIAAIKRAGCDAVAPGYGFLAENADFARRCEEEGIRFLGPSATEIAAFGDKISALDRAEASGVPVAPSLRGYEFSQNATVERQTVNQIVNDTVRFVKAHGKCVVKAAAGGGGKGIRVIDLADIKGDITDAKIRRHVRNMVNESRSEAKTQCNDKLGRVFVEKFTPIAKHIEIQVAGDHTGDAVHFGARECSLQDASRQKVFEMTGVVDPWIEAVLGALSVRMVKDTHKQEGEGYVNLGTVEFMVTEEGEAAIRNAVDLLRTKGESDEETLAKVLAYFDDDPSLLKEKVCFLEVNTRLQVEHAITEERTEIGLKELQLQISDERASLRELGITQADNNKRLAERKGKVSIELRLNALEAGVIGDIKVPPDRDYGRDQAGVRWVGRDIERGRKLTGDYDKNILKLVVTTDSYEQALDELREQLEAFWEDYIGPEMNIPGLLELLEKPDAIRNATTTTLVDQPELMALGPTRKRQQTEKKRIMNGCNLLADRMELQKNPETRMPIAAPGSALPDDFDLAKLEDSGPTIKELATRDDGTLDRDKVIELMLESTRQLFTITQYRDAHQSLFATRAGTLELILNLAEEIAMFGPEMFSAEIAGGATVNTMMYFLLQNPFERLRMAREAMLGDPNGPDAAKKRDVFFQMLIRGCNFLGYAPQPDNVVREGVELFAEAGVDIFRIFNCVNDVDDLIRSTRIVKKLREEKGLDILAETAICFTGNLPHDRQYDLNYYLRIVDKLLDSDSPPDILAIKDMSGQMTPEAARILISAIKKRMQERELNIPIHLHVHSTGGWSDQTVEAASEEGVEVIDLAVPPWADGFSQPSFVTFMESLPEDVIPRAALDDIKTHMVPYWEKCSQMLSPYASETRSEVEEWFLRHQIPGGQLVNWIAQARSNLGEEGFEFIELLRAYEVADRLLFGGEDEERWHYRGIKVTPSSKAVGDLAIALVSEGRSLTGDLRQAYDAMMDDIHPDTRLNGQRFWNNAYIQEMIHNFPEENFPATVLDLLAGRMGENEFGFNPALKRVVKARLGKNPKIQLEDFDFEDQNRRHYAEFGEALTREHGLLRAIFDSEFTSMFYVNPGFDKLDTRTGYQGPEVKADGTSEPFQITLLKEDHSLQLVSAVPDPDNPDRDRVTWLLDPGTDNERTIVSRVEAVKQLPSDVSGAEVPFPGKLLRFSEEFKIGEVVEEGTTLAEVEAMKMIVSITAPFTGEIAEVMQGAAPGDSVLPGVLIRMNRSPQAALASDDAAPPDGVYQIRGDLQPRGPRGLHEERRTGLEWLARRQIGSNFMLNSAQVRRLRTLLGEDQVIHLPEESARYMGTLEATLRQRNAEPLEKLQLLSRQPSRMPNLGNMYLRIAKEVVTDLKEKKHDPHRDGGLTWEYLRNMQLLEQTEARLLGFRARNKTRQGVEAAIEEIERAKVLLRDLAPIADDDHGPRVPERSMAVRAEQHGNRGQRLEFGPEDNVTFQIVPGAGGEFFFKPGAEGKRAPLRTLNDEELRRIQTRLGETRSRDTQGLAVLMANIKVEVDQVLASRVRVG